MNQTVLLIRTTAAFVRLPLASRSRWIDESPDDTLGEVQRKEAQFRRLVVSEDYRHEQQVADAWCAAFVQPKQPGCDPALCITTDAVRGLEADPDALAPAQRREVERVAREYQFFHWHLAFPDVFGGGDGGFDCVLGNPPWEHTELKEKEWFAERRPDIADARTGIERKRMIATLKDEDPALHAAFTAALHKYDGISHLLRDTGRYPFCGRGRVNLYAVFAETMRNLLNERGRAGCVLPTGIATDDTTKRFFQDVVRTRALASLFDFENMGIFFPDVHRNYKFCLFTAGRGLRPTADRAEFVFFAHAVEALRDPERRFVLSPEDIALLNPNTRTCPIFRSSRDAELAKAIYRRVPVLIREARDGQSEDNPWGIRFKQGLFNMTTDSDLFHTREHLEADGWKLAGNLFRKDGVEYLPLYEAKMIHQFDHRWASYREEGGKPVSGDVSLPDKQDPAFAVLPRYWVEAREVHRRIPATSTTDSSRNPHPRRAADLPGSLETPSSLQPSRAVARDGDADGNANLLSARPPGAQWTEGTRSSMRVGGPRIQEVGSARGQEAGGPITQRTGSPRTLNTGGSRTEYTGSLPSADASFDPSQSFARRPLADATGTSVRSSTETEASALAGDGLKQENPRWLMGWRDITRSVEKRTTIADIIPFAAIGNKFLLMFPVTSARLAGAMLGALNSFVFDFVVRQKISGASLPYLTMKQTAVLPPEGFSDADLAFLVPRVLELLYTGEDLRDFAHDCGWDGPPFRWDEERRFLLRCELDAAFFHLYLPADTNGDWRPACRADGCPSDETSEQLADLKRHFPTPRDAITGILDTFPGVRREEERICGGYRTKQTILEMYDEFESAIHNVRPYETRLDPPPAASKCCHISHTI